VIESWREREREGKKRCGLQRGERLFYDYNKAWECYSASQCIGKHCSIPKEQQNIGKLLCVAFCDFLEIFPKIYGTKSYREAVVNALTILCFDQF
jgi:hypothetical protein